MLKHHRSTLRLTSLLGFFANFLALGVVAPEASAAAPAAPAAPTPSPSAAAPGAAPSEASAKGGAPAAPAPVATASLRDIIRASATAVMSGKAPAAALAGLTAERDAAVARADKAEADLATAQASLKSTTAHVTTFCGLLGIEAKDLAGKDTAAVADLFQSRLKSAVTEELGSLGFPAAALPAPSSTATGTGDTVEDLRASINAETDPAKRGALVVKLRAAQAAAKKTRAV